MSLSRRPACAAYSRWFVPAIPWTVIGLVWVYMLIQMHVLDVVKLALCRRLRHVAARPQWYRRFLGSRHAAQGVAEAAKAEAQNARANPHMVKKSE